MGGPDLDPTRADQGLRNAYDLVRGVKNLVPTGFAVQYADYNAPPSDIYKFGRDDLHLDFIFWLNKIGGVPNVDDVYKMVSAKDFPKDKAGGLNQTYPTGMSPDLSETRF